MYVIDFFKNLFKKSNIGVIIWMTLNTLLICAMFSGMFTSLEGVLTGLGVYAVSIVIALSPIGEFILRYQTGCVKIKDQAVLQRLMPIFNEVYARAKELNPELNSGINIYMSEDDSPNAFATGRKTVCITRGLLKYSDEEIKAILGHEFGHLAHKDTDTLLVMSVGNTIVTVIFTLIRIFANIAIFISDIISAASDGSAGFIASIFSLAGRFFYNIVLVLLMRLWTQIGVWICMSSSRKNEFLADEYSAKCGYGHYLAKFLSRLGLERSGAGLFASLSSSHPENADRVEKLCAYAR